MTTVGRMQFIGIILFVFSCIGMIGGFIYGDSNFGGYSYEFSLALAWGWWSSALVLLALSGICFSLPTISETLTNISSNTKKSFELQEKLDRLLRKSEVSTDYSKSGDAPEYPRAKGESDSDYWERVSKRQHFADTPKQGDDPRFPRFRDELNYDYWERVKRATQNK